MRNDSEIRQHMFQVIEQWKQSGLSQNAFCEQQSIRFHKFYYWYKCYRRVNDIADENKGSFVKLKIEKPLVASSVEIHFPGGARVLFHEPVSSNYLKTLISQSMLHLSASCKYYLYRNATDMRKGFDSLCGLVTSELKMNVLSGSVFIFMNKKHNQVKLLLWEGDGFAVYYKRLEKGTYEMPAAGKNNTGSSITNEALQHILQGVSLKSVHKRKRYQHLTENCG